MEELVEDGDKVTIKPSSSFPKRHHSQRFRPTRLQSFEQDDKKLKRQVLACTSSIQHTHLGGRPFSNPTKRFNSKHQKTDRPWHVMKETYDDDGTSNRFIPNPQKRHSGGRGSFNRPYRQSNPSRDISTGIHKVHQAITSTTGERSETLPFSTNEVQGSKGNGGMKPKHLHDYSVQRKFGYRHRTEANIQQLPTCTTNSQANRWQQHKQGEKHSSRRTMTIEDKPSQYARKDRSWIVKSFRFETLLELTSKAPNEIVSRLHDDLKGFLRTLEQDLKPRVVDSVMLLLFKVAECLQDTGEAKPKASLILAEILSPRCTHFQLCLKLYATRDILHCKSCTCDIQYPRKHTIHDFKECRVQSLYKFFRRLLEAIPSIAWRILPIDEFIQSVKHMHAGLNFELVAEVEVLKQLQIESRDLYIVNQPSPAVLSSQCAQLTWDNSEYRELPIFPEWQELCTPDPPAKLRANIVSGKYIDWMHYYDIQFRLLREDFTAPLRRGICEYLQGNRGRQLRDIRVYRDVILIAPLFTKEGISFKVQFANFNLKHCKWEHSKRLLFGSLLCFSPDGFKETVLFATVINRDLKELNEGCIDVQFQGGIPMLAFYLKKQMFTIVESSAYFEASRHIMTSLQNAETETMPFTNYLINNQCDSVAAPHYLQQREENMYELKCVYNDAACSKTIHRIHRKASSTNSQSPPVDRMEEESSSDEMGEEFSSECIQVKNCNVAQWPQIEDTLLDNSQLDALKMALTQEIVVIQGPPGTGKTFMGIKIVQALIANRKQWDPKGESPILVMCYTNHALDQFLEGILPMVSPGLPISPYTQCTKVVRVGGRSKSEQISKLNLKNQRHNVYLPRDVHFQRNETGAVVTLKQTEVEKAFTELTIAQDSFLTLKELENEILTGNPEHHYQLLNLAETPEEIDKALELWLGLWEEYNEEPDPSDKTLLQDSNSISEALPSDKQQYDTLNTPIHSTIIPTHSNSDEIKSVARNDEISSFTQSESIEPFSEFKPTDEKQASAVNLNLPDTQILSSGNSVVEPQQNTTEMRTSSVEDELLDVEGEALMENDARMLDDDDAYLELIQYKVSVREQIVDQSASEKTMPQESPGMLKPAVYLRKSKDFDLLLINGLRKGRFTEDQVEEQRDLASLPNEQRWKLYNYWKGKYLASLEDQSEVRLREYNESCKEMKIVQQNADRFTLETADIIGITTTGAAKYQHVLHMVKPRIVIVEEAAEVLESHIVSALNAGTQHLILIGDHKQLKPKPNEYNLSKKYNLDVSLFERLIRNNFPHATLNIQHRMRPEIANLVRPHIYTSLVDHESVLKYGDVRGVKNNLFFIQHEHNETHDENILSHSNPHEAAYLAALCKYFLQQGYQPEQITILVTYTGQLLLLRSMMPRKVFEGVLVRTVDNYQGEENDLVLLSLVRSNNDGNVGFLREDNRICVALSRAKVGFYCIGNFNMLREKSTLWEAILKDMEAKQLVSDRLQVCCNNHPSTAFTAKMPTDFTKSAPDGGCLEDCQFRLQCGHVCARKCHSFDCDHTEYKCKKNCVLKCPEGHDCPKPCFEDCGNCMKRVSKLLPICGHNAFMLCYELPENFRCLTPCEKLCKSGHPCPKLCYETCNCVVKVPKTIPSCGHVQMVACCRYPSLFKCMANCDRKCTRGHPCQKICSEWCGECKVIVEKTLPDCSHVVRIECHSSSMRITCTMPCEKILKCGHLCQTKCGENCSTMCYTNINKTLECGHDKKIFCYEKLLNVHYKCFKPCRKVLPCKHPCKQQCCEPCTDKCMVTINKKWPCGHKLKRRCYQTENPENFPCNKKCERKRPCGHICSNLCGQTCTSKCNLPINKVLQCGHQRLLQCHIKAETFKCDTLCKFELKCGHKCAGICGECRSKRCHLSCKYSMELKRFCGHKSGVQCVDLNDVHPAGTQKQCLTQCVHRACPGECTSECRPCEQPCPWNCPHFTCSKLCHEICDRPRCNKPCCARLNCGHPCVGVCGEPCLSVCPICQTKQFNTLLAKGYKQDEQYIQLMCGHIYVTKYLDQYTSDMTCDNTMILPISCPKCKKPLTANHRYGNVCKWRYLDKQAVQETIRTLILKHSVTFEQASKLENRLATTTATRFDKVDTCSLTLRERKSHMKDGWWSDHNERLHSFQLLPRVTKHIMKLQDRLLPDNVANIGPQENFLNTLLINAIEHICAYKETAGSTQQSELLSSIDVNLHLSTYIVMLTQLLDGRSRLSAQIVYDITSEMYHLSLMLQLFLIENTIQYFTPSAILPMMDPPLETFLISLERNHTLRVAEADYIMYSKNMKKFYAGNSRGKMPIDYEVVVRDIAEFTPPILKGYWRKCIRGHYYCSPLTISKDSWVPCQECLRQ